MTSQVRIESYITGTLWDGDLGTYGGWLRERGFAEATVRDRIRFAAHCERVLGGDVDPRHATTDHIELLELRMSHVRKRTMDNYIRAWTDFVRAINEGTGNGGAPYWRSESCDSDIGRFNDWMVSAGVADTYRKEHVKFARHCLRLVWEVMGDIQPDAMDVDVVSRLNDHMSGTVSDNMRIRYLRSFRMFLNFMNGTNPYRDLTVPDRQADFMSYVYSIVRGSEYECELQAFIGAMDHRGLRPYIIIDKVRSTMSCIDRLYASGWTGGLDDIDTSTIEYLRSVMHGLKETTVQVYLRNFGTFLEFVTGANPYRDAHLLWNSSGDSVDRRFIFREDFRCLMDHAELDERLILVLGAGMGLRRSEIAWLRLDDIQGDSLRIRGKGHGPDGKVVTMRMIPEVRKAIEDYLPFRERVIGMFGDHSEGALLVRYRMQPGEHMTPDCIGGMIRGLGERAGVDSSTHCLRRLFATSLYDVRTDIDTLRRMMRHESVSTTMRCYLASDPRKMSTANQNLSGYLFGNAMPSQPLRPYLRTVYET